MLPEFIRQIMQGGGGGAAVAPYPQPSIQQAAQSIGSIASQYPYALPAIGAGAALAAPAAIAAQPRVRQQFGQAMSEDFGTFMNLAQQALPFTALGLMMQARKAGGGAQAAPQTVQGPGGIPINLPSGGAQGAPQGGGGAQPPPPGGVPPWLKSIGAAGAAGFANRALPAAQGLSRNLGTQIGNTVAMPMNILSAASRALPLAAAAGASRLFPRTRYWGDQAINAVRSLGQQGSQFLGSTPEAGPTAMPTAQPTVGGAQAAYGQPTPTAGPTPTPTRFAGDLRYHRGQQVGEEAVHSDGSVFVWNGRDWVER